MSSASDGLVDHLVFSIALTGSQGLSANAFIKSILEHLATVQVDEPSTAEGPEDLFLSDNPPVQKVTPDSIYLESTWELLCRQRDVFSKPCDPKALSGTDDAVLPSQSDFLHHHLGERLHTTEQRIWHTVAGHGVDWKKVPKLEFQCLCVIAAHGPTGVLQPDVVALTGQDKRSVPKRTDSLADKGYITKEPCQGGGAKTSLLRLKRFANQSAHGMAHQVTSATARRKGAENGLQIYRYDLWYDEIMKLMQGTTKPVAYEDLRMACGVVADKFGTRGLNRCMWRLADGGVIERIYAYPGEDLFDNLEQAVLDHSGKPPTRCVRLLREPNKHDRDAFMASVKKGSLYSKDKDHTLFDDNDVEELAPEATEAKQPSIFACNAVSKATIWTTDLPMANVLFAAVASAGPKGAGSAELSELLGTTFWRRPFDELAARLTDDWHRSQPPHLRHLAVVRDTTVQGAATHFIFRTFKNFQLAVEQGEASWEYLLTPDGIAKYSQQQQQALDQWGFPVHSPADFYRDGSNTVAQCGRAATMNADYFDHGRKLAKRMEPSTGTPIILTVDNDEASPTPGAATPEVKVESSSRPAASPDKPKKKIGRPRKNKGAPNRLEKKAANLNKLYRDAKAQWKKRAKARATAMLETLEEAELAAVLAAFPPLQKETGTQQASPAEEVQSTPTVSQNAEASRPSDDQTMADAVPATEETFTDAAAPAADRTSTEGNSQSSTQIGVYINSERAVALHIASKGAPHGRGRPRKRLLVTFASPRLRDFAWFSTPAIRMAKASDTASTTMPTEPSDPVAEAPAAMSKAKSLEVLMAGLMILHQPGAYINEPRAVMVHRDHYSSGRGRPRDGLLVTIKSAKLQELTCFTPDSSAGPSRQLLQLVPSLLHDPYVKEPPEIEDAEEQEDDMSDVPEEEQIEDVTEAPTLREQTVNTHTEVLEPVPLAASVPAADPDVEEDVEMQDAEGEDDDEVQANMGQPSTDAEMTEAPLLMPTSCSVDVAAQQVPDTPSQVADTEPQDIFAARSDVAEATASNAEAQMSTPARSRVLSEIANSQPSTPADEILDIKTPQPDVHSTSTGLGMFDMVSAGVKQGPRVVRRRAGITRSGGMKELQRGNAVLKIIAQCGGVFPEKAQLFWPFATQWQEQYGHVPDRHTMDRTVTKLLNTGKLNKITYSFQSPDGAPIIKYMLADPSVDPAGPVARALQQKVQDKWPAMYLPEGLNLPAGAQKRLQEMEARALAPVKARLQAEVEREQAIAQSLTTGDGAEWGSKAKRRYMIYEWSSEEEDLDGNLDDEVEALTASFQLDNYTFAPADAHLDRGEFGRKRLGRRVYLQPDTSSKRGTSLGTLKAMREKVAAAKAAEKQEKAQAAEKLTEEPATTVTERASDVMIDPSLLGGAVGSSPIVGMPSLPALAPAPAREAHPAVKSLYTPSGVIWSNQAYSTHRKRTRTELEEDPDYDPEEEEGALADRHSAQDRTLVSGTGFPHKRMRRRRLGALSGVNIRESAYDLPMTNKDKDRLLYACAVVKTLTGGLQQGPRTINFATVNQALHFKFDGKYCREHWNHVRSKHEAYVDRLQEQFRRIFLEAYERGEIPEMNFASPEQIDWAWLVDWAEAHLDRSAAGNGALPDSRADFERMYDLDTSHGAYAPNPEGFFGSNVSSIFKEDTVASLAYFEPLQHPAPAPAQEDMLAQSWIRANVLTPAEGYDALAAHAKLTILPAEMLARATEAMLGRRMIKGSFKGRRRNMPGRNFVVGDDLKLIFPLPWQWDEALFSSAAQFKTVLDEAFAAEGAYTLRADSAAANAETMVVLNMLDAERVTVQVDLSDASLTKWGFTKGDYKTMFLDRERLVFPIIVRPAEGYRPGPVVQRAGVPRGEVFAEDGPEGYERLPFWIDVHGNVVPELLRSLTITLLYILMQRPGVGAEKLAAVLKDRFWPWELELWARWAEEAGIVERDGDGWACAEWWWMVWEVIGQDEKGKGRARRTSS